jgi:hypothetical protein
MESRFGRDFSRVRVHTDERAARSARSVGALAYTVDAHVVFAGGQHAPTTSEGRELIAHELTHVAQQGQAPPLARRAAPEDHRSGGGHPEQQAETMAAAVMAGPVFGVPMYASAGVQKRGAPYIKKITVHLTPPQSAELDWVGTPPTGSDSFPVSTGKGYSDPGDDPGTCTRDCCKDALKQCAPPWNEPGRVGACCTYHGDKYWTGTPLDEHNGWKWWTPIQPYYSSRGIALHQHPEVTGQPIGHGCVRMAEENAKRIFDFSNGSKTNVTIDGRAAPVLCENDRTCASAKKSSTTSPDSTSLGPTGQLEAVPGLEGRAS